MEGGGFGLHVRGTAAAPVKTFVLISRYPGSSNPTRRAIGRYPYISLESARKIAEEWRALIKKGIDPKTAAAEQKAQEAARLKAEAAQVENSFKTVAEEFIKRHVSKTRKADVVARDSPRIHFPLGIETTF